MQGLRKEIDGAAACISLAIIDDEDDDRDGGITGDDITGDDINGNGKLSQPPLSLQVA